MDKIAEKPIEENESHKKKITIPSEVSFDKFKSCVKYILSYKIPQKKYELNVLDENQETNFENTNPSEENNASDKDVACSWIGLFLTKILGILFFTVLFILSKIRCFVFKKIAENSAKKNEIEILFEDKSIFCFSEKNISSYLQSISTIFAFFIKIFAAIGVFLMTVDKEKIFGKSNSDKL